LVSPARDESGQAVVEYVLLLSITFSLFLIVAKGLSVFKVEEKLLRPLSVSYAAAYRYGHPEALGFEDGGPKKHPRAIAPGTESFRIFINPRGN
jgi:hypothetical protein